MRPIPLKSGGDGATKILRIEWIANHQNQRSSPTTLLGMICRQASGPAGHPLVADGCDSESSMWSSNRPLVLVSLSHLWPYTSSLSTSWSMRGLSSPKRHPHLIFGGASRLDAFSVYPFAT